MATTMDVHRSTPPATVATTAVLAPRRITWGAIFAGVVVALAIQLVLNLLGLGIGLETLEGDAPGARSLGIGAGVWWLCASLVALFVGGLVAGRLAGLPRRLAGALHGLTVWSVATLVGVYLTTMLLGTLASGVLGVLGTTASLVGSAAGQIEGAVQGGPPGVAGVTADSLWTDIQRELRQALRQTGEPALQPSRLEQQANQVTEQTRQSAQQAARSPEQAEQEVRTLWDQIVQRTRTTVSEVDREALANVVAARTDMSQAQARAAVDRWATQLEQARQQLATQAAQAADRTAEAMSDAALWSFGILVLGALAAAVGGLLGAPRSLRVDQVEQV